MQEKFLWFPRKPGLPVLFPISVSAVTEARAHMRAHTRAYTHMDIDTHTHGHTHIHTHTVCTIVKTKILESSLTFLFNCPQHSMPPRSSLCPP